MLLLEEGIPEFYSLSFIVIACFSIVFFIILRLTSKINTRSFTLFLLHWAFTTMAFFKMMKAILAFEIGGKSLFSLALGITGLYWALGTLLMLLGIYFSTHKRDKAK